MDWIKISKTLFSTLESLFLVISVCFDFEEGVTAVEETLFCNTAQVSMNDD